MRMVNLCKNKLFNTGLMLFLCLGLQAQNKDGGWLRTTAE